MAKKRNRNPLLEKKWNEGYEQGKKDGVAQAINFFTDKFKGLDEVPGIGDKTMVKIRKQLGHKYFN